MHLFRRLLFTFNLIPNEHELIELSFAKSHMCANANDNLMLGIIFDASLEEKNQNVLWIKRNFLKAIEQRKIELILNSSKYFDFFKVITSNSKRQLE